MPPQSVRRFVALSLPLVLAGVTLALVIRVGRAAPAASSYFVTTAGAGACSQASPCQLQTALNLAGTGATIYVGQGTYHGAGAAVITVTHSLKLLGGWSGDPVGLPLVNPAIYTTTVDGQDSRRGIYVGSGLTPTIAGFRVTHGNATGLFAGCLANSAKGCGGGMFVNNAAADIENNTFINNTALVTATTYGQGHGGGLYLELGSGSVISHNVFVDNTAAGNGAQLQGQGGGLDLHGANINTVVIANNQFIGNGGAEWGGGLSLGTTNNLQVHGNLFQDNTANSGGGLYTWYCNAGIFSNTFYGNSGDAAAYLGFYTGYFSANLLVDNPTVAGIVIAYGNGGLDILYNNIVGQNGQLGIDAYAGVTDALDFIAIDNTIVGPGTGTGLLIGSGYVTTTAIGTLFSGFSTGIKLNYPASATVTANYTLFDNGVTSTGNAIFTHNVFGAAAFVNPPGRDYHLQATSAARDAGTLSIVTTDFDGDQRPLGAQADIGADETRFNRAVFLPLTRR